MGNTYIYFKNYNNLVNTDQSVEITKPTKIIFLIYYEFVITYIFTLLSVLSYILFIC